MNPGGSLIISAAIVAGAASSQQLIAGVLAQDGSSPADIATQGGVLGAAVLIGWWMLNRSDRREKEQAAAAAVQREADLRALRDELALAKAEILENRDKLIDALVEKASTAQALADMATLVGELRTRIAQLEAPGGLPSAT